MSKEETGQDFEKVPETLDPQVPKPKEPIATKQKKKMSRFHEFYKKIGSPSDLALFLENFQKDVSDPKTGSLSTLLQALSGRSQAGFFDEFFSEYKPHALFILEKAFDIFASSKRTAGVGAGGGNNSYQATAPFLLEFVIRCEGAGMKKSSWMKDVTGPMVGQDQLPAQSAKDMLNTISLKDIKGKCHRRVEIVTSKEEVIHCAIHMTKDEFSAKVRGGDEDALPAGDMTNVVGKLFSKCRKVVTSKNTENVKDGEGDNIRQKRGREEEATELKDEQNEDKKKPSIPCPVDVIEAMVKVMEISFQEAKIPPPPKYNAFVEWMKRSDECSEDLTNRLNKLEDAVSVLADAEADQLEVVMELKACGPDVNMFQAAVSKAVKLTSSNTDGDNDENGEEEEVLKLTSPDVLSALAVAAGKLKEEDDGVLSQRTRAIKLLEKASIGGVALPRRAMSLVVDERAKERRRKQGPKESEE